MINFKAVFRIIGGLTAITGIFMLLCLPFSWAFNTGDSWPIAQSGLLAFFIGILVFFGIRPTNLNIQKRDGYLVVGLSWIVMSFLGTLPYLLSGVIPNFFDALFESVSGFTTTGATVLQDIESVSKGILFWRSLTQWIGGMGIVVLTVAIFPLLGIGGVELFVAESSGSATEKLHPRIRETAKRLWLIYVGLTGLLTLFLFAAGMTFYDAINHALTTMATGGFSTKNASMAAFDVPGIQYITIIFMFLAGTNFTIIYYGLKRKFENIWSSDEFRAYVFLVVFLTAGVTFKVYFLSDLPFEKAFRDSLFQIVSIITTTGFVSADYTTWSTGLTMLFFLMMFLGASAGSTSGGIKLIRHLVYFRNSYLEFKRLIHPTAIVTLKLNGKAVSGKILIHIIIFLLLYMILFVIGCIIMSVLGYDLPTTIGAIATSLGNVGPGLGKVGPVDNFAWIGPGTKMLLSFYMLLGRLELFTILVLFTPYFWKAN